MESAGSAKADGVKISRAGVLPLALLLHQGKLGSVNHSEGYFRQLLHRNRNASWDSFSGVLGGPNELVLVKGLCTANYYMKSGIIFHCCKIPFHSNPACAFFLMLQLYSI